MLQQAAAENPTGLDHPDRAAAAAEKKRQASAPPAGAPGPGHQPGPRIRVLMSLPDKRVRGGPPSHLYLLHDSLQQLGLDMRSFIYGGRTHNESKARKVLGRLADLIRFPLVIAQHRPNIVHLNSAYDRKGVLRDVFFVPTARLLGRTVVTKFHGSDLQLLANSSRLWRTLTWLVVRGSNVICVLSQQEADAFRARFPRQNVSVVKNALDLSRYNDGADYRTRYGIPADKRLLLFVARFIHSKGLKEVIEALPIVRKRHNAHALLLGDGPALDENRRLAEQLGLTGHVTFTGYVPEDETVGAYCASDLLVFPSYHEEGMPMVIWHSLACGLPIITTRIRAAADWLQERRHALFVPPRDPVRLAEAINTLLDDDILRAQMRTNGPELARRFDRRHVAADFAELYRSLARTARATKTMESRKPRNPSSDVQP